ncbi:MAG: hypothetical protein K0S31_3638 [Sphingobacterium multivorum]|jgi:hypothetical protein|nr:hypothetical protein [Sphingobacterium multivorum]
METANFSQENERQYSKKLSPEKVISILDKHGTKVSIEEAAILLEFMRKIADITVNQYLSVTLWPTFMKVNTCGVHSSAISA